MTLDGDTIVAVSTAPGRGGIGIVRLSGTKAREIAEPMLRLRSALAPGRARFATILDPAGAALDEAVVTFFAAPHSYTAEDVVEIAAHGAPVLLDAVVRGAVAGGARLAEPGEFTQRAFLHGRLDLTQAEAVQDLIAAQTLAQARLAAAQLGGSLAQAVTPVKQRLVRLIAALEAGVDFAEDDLDLPAEAEVLSGLAEVEAALAALEGTFAYGRIVREGFTLAIVGRPNAGKSSLFNRLLARERAIVTAHPGTTRDPIAETLSLDGIPVQLIDTAGLREVPSGPEGEAEAHGILRSRTAMAEADLVLLVVDASSLDGWGRAQELEAEDVRTLAGLAGRPCLIALNKADLAAADRVGAALAMADLAMADLRPDNRVAADRDPDDRAAGVGRPLDVQVGAIATSALTGEGVEALKTAIVETLTRTAPSAGSALLTNVRQHQALSAALDAVHRAQSAAAASIPHDLLLLDLYVTLEALDELTGATAPDTVLHLIFSTFCIGK